jgi:hypothetical protein
VPWYPPAKPAPVRSIGGVELVSKAERSVLVVERRRRGARACLLEVAVSATLLDVGYRLK